MEFIESRYNYTANEESKFGEIFNIHEFAETFTDCLEGDGLAEFVTEDGRVYELRYDIFDENRFLNICKKHNIAYVHWYNR